MKQEKAVKEEEEGSIENSPKLAPLTERKVSSCWRKGYLKKYFGSDHSCNQHFQLLKETMYDHIVKSLLCVLC